MKHKLTLTLTLLIFASGVSSAQLLNAYSQRRIVTEEKKPEIPLKYFFYAAAEGGYWSSDLDDDVALGAQVGFEYRIKASNVYVGAKIGIIGLLQTVDREGTAALFTPTLSYICNTSSIKKNTFEATIGCGLGIMYEFAIAPELNLTYWIRDFGVGTTGRYINVESDPNVFILMARVAMRF